MRTITKIAFMVLVSALPICAHANQPMAGRRSEKTWTGTVTGVNQQDKTVTGKSWWFSKTFPVVDQIAPMPPSRPAETASAG